jgi:Uncharacterized protein conserved in bacteria
MIPDNGGLYGSYQALDQLDDRGDPVFTTDFRDIYYTIAQQWWGLSSDTKKTWALFSNCHKNNYTLTIKFSECDHHHRQSVLYTPQCYVTFRLL